MVAHSSGFLATRNESCESGLLYQEFMQTAETCVAVAHGTAEHELGIFVGRATGVKKTSSNQTMSYQARKSGGNLSQRASLTWSICVIVSKKVIVLMRSGLTKQWRTPLQSRTGPTSSGSRR